EQRGDGRDAREHADGGESECGAEACEDQHDASGQQQRRENPRGCGHWFQRGNDTRELREKQSSTVVGISRESPAMLLCARRSDSFLMATCPRCKGHLTDTHRCPKSRVMVALEIV